MIVDEKTKPEETIEDLPEETPDETPDTDSEDSEPIEEQDDDSTEAPKKGKESEESDVASEEEYLSELRKKHGLPDGIDSFEKLAETFSSLQKGMQRPNRTQEDDYKAPREDKPEKFESPFDDRAASKAFEEMNQNGLFADDEARSTWKRIAGLVDSSYGKQMKVMERFAAEMSQMVMRLESRSLNMEFNGLKPEFRKAFQRKDLDRIMRDHNFPDYNSAVKFAIHTDRPDLMNLLFERGREEGRKEGQKQKFFRRTGAKPGNGGGQQFNPKEWIRNGTPDMSKINKLPQKKGDWILDRLAKAGY